jgi:hypothetical protein
MFEMDPEVKTLDVPSILEPELFIRTPSEMVSKTNEAEVAFK